MCAIDEPASSHGINGSLGRHLGDAEEVQTSGTCLPGDSSTDCAVRPVGTDAEAHQFEAMLVDVSSKFVNVPANEVDQEIENAQRHICECLGLDLSALWQWSAGGTSDLMVTHTYWPSDLPARPPEMNAREYFPWCRQECLAGRVIAVSSIEELPAEAARDKEIFRQLGILTALTIPLSTGAGPIIGVLSFNTTRAERTWPQAIVKRLQLVAQVFANALARKGADEALRESEARLQMATEAAGAGLWAMEPDGSSVWASVRTRELFQFPPDQTLSYKDFVERIHPEDRARVDQAVRQATQAEQPFLVDYRLALPKGQISWIRARGRWQCGLGGQRLLMGLYVDVTEHKQAEEVQRAHDHMQRELDIARQVQQDLLPKEPLTIPGYALAGWSRAATQAGGDYYDWLMLPDGRAVVTIGDATGHGIGAALLVTVCRAYFRAVAHVDSAIEDVVARVNDLIADDVQEATFVTAAIAALDPRKNLLHVYSAGHGPILFYHAAQSKVLDWGGDNFPLGIFRPMSVGPSRSLALEPGDILLLITDGFFEWADPEARQYGIERLRRFLKQHHGSAPESIIRALHEDVLAFARGTPQEDDLTAVIIKRDLPPKSS